MDDNYLQLSALDHPSVLLETLQSLEDIVQYRQQPPPNSSFFTYAPGNSPLLISAPHGAAHTRNGRFKIEDEFTTGFARYIAQKTGCHALYTTHYSPNEDPNWDKGGRYKQRLRHIIQEQNIKFVLDLHGMTSRYHMGLALGTRHGRACPDQLPLITAQLEKYGYVPNSPQELPPPLKIDLAKYRAGLVDFSTRRWDNYVVDYSKFTGGLKNHTVTRYVNENLGLPAIQIEVSSQARVVMREAYAEWDRIYRGNPQAIIHTVQTLTELVQVLTASLE